MSAHEKTPFDLENARTPENKAMYDEKELSENQKIERLRPGAHLLIEAHRKEVVPKVQALLSRYGSYEEIPENECEDLADKLGGYEPEMIKALALELGEENKA